ncbi:50S ribosomal protein L35 [Thermodesulfobacterium sp. TA1]|uniref:50S ribosomal protein L35 n=1 Tax=Thermodesulfobacterium sp. TA1 TaxID=2234087 RepID=UPI001231D553|nr:50S ribosomal protein L35 [Thermodesulfobacterium sp. TA1]QER41371.1 50S ribosomal protein L35 [Thermodesulfobacterium sp. TA1]
MAKVKMKTNRSAAKRFKVTANGKIMHKKAGKSHLLRKKSRKTKRHLKGYKEIFVGFYDHIAKAIADKF